MEYTKDMILHVNYGQVRKQKNTYKLFKILSKIVSKHKIIVTIISITLMLVILDFMLIASFIQILSNI